MENYYLITTVGHFDGLRQRNFKLYTSGYTGGA